MFENHQNGLNKSRAELDIDRPTYLPTVVKSTVVQTPNVIALNYNSVPNLSRKFGSPRTNGHDVTTITIKDRHFVDSYFEQIEADKEGDAPYKPFPTPIISVDRYDKNITHTTIKDRDGVDRYFMTKGIYTPLLPAPWSSNTKTAPVPKTQSILDVIVGSVPKTVAPVVVASTPKTQSILDVIVASAPKTVAPVVVAAPKLPSVLDIMIATAPKTVATVATTPAPTIATKTATTVLPATVKPVVPSVIDAVAPPKPKINTVRNIAIGALVLFGLYKLLK